MARGQQKIQSQQKAAEKQAKMKKQAGHSATDQKKAAAVALKASCSVCKVKFQIIKLHSGLFCSFLSHFKSEKSSKNFQKMTLK